MGASEEEYRRAAPHNSFIHVDQFEGPQQLAEHLHMLDRNDEKYNEYFKVGRINITSFESTNVKLLSENFFEILTVT